MLYASIFFENFFLKKKRKEKRKANDTLSTWSECNHHCGGQKIRWTVFLPKTSFSTYFHLKTHNKQS